MTEEEFLQLCKPGITLEDFKPTVIIEDEEFKKRLEDSIRRQKECLKQRDAPFRNYLITI